MLVEHLINKTKYKLSYEEHELYRDSAFNDIWGDQEKDYKYLFNSMVKNIQKLAKQKSKTFEKFLKKYSKSNSYSIQRIIIKGLLSNPDHYIEQVFNIICYFHQNKFITYDNKLLESLRKLLNTSYQYFSQSQKTAINILILSIHENKEYYIEALPDENKKLRRTFFGHTQYMYLCSIPEKEIRNQPNLLKKHQEFNRRYGKIEIFKDRPMASIVGAPLSKKAYDKMSYENWIKSFKKYDKDDIRDYRYNRGGEVEHGRVFSVEVKIDQIIFIHLLRN